MRFALSTHVFHHVRLGREHLAAIKAAGWTAVEIFATRTHVDYRDPAAIDALAAGLRDQGLSAISMHLPICDGFVEGVWGRAYSTAAADPARRREAIDESDAACAAARRLGCRTVVAHVGLPDAQDPPPSDNDPGAARRSAEDLARVAAAHGVRLALEVMPNALSTPAELVGMLEGDLDLGETGLCLDVGHAHLMGDVVLAVEAVAGHLLTTHLHDNRRASDDHLVPWQGSLPWMDTLVALQKVGYAGPLVFEVAAGGDPDAVMARSVDARTRLQAILKDLSTFSFES